LQEHVAAGQERARELAQQRLPEHEALLVALLPPRVREMDEDSGEAAVGEAPHREARIFGEDARTRGEPELAELPVHDGRPLEPHFEADDGQRWIGGEPLEHEAAASGTYLELDGAAVTLDELARVDLLAFGKPWS